MATFQAQVQSLTGLTISSSGTNPTESELNQFLKDGVIDVTTKWLTVRPAEIESFARESSEQVANATLDINGARIISVVREGGTNNYWRNCRKILSSQQYDVIDENSLYFATEYQPTYMLGSDSKVSVFPTPVNNGTDAFKVYYVNNDPVNKSDAALEYSHDGIGYFSDDKVYLVVIYAGMRSLQSAMAGLKGNTEITTAFSSIVSEINKVDNILSTAEGKVNNYYTDIAEIDDTTELWDGTNKRFTVIRDALVHAQELIDNNKPDAAYDAYQNLLDVNAALDGMQTHLADGEFILGTDPSSGTIAVALTAVNTNIDNAVASASDMRTEIGLANGKVDNALTEIANTVPLTDKDSSNIQIAVDAMKTANSKFRADGSDPALFGDENQYETSVGMVHVKDALDKAQNLIDGASMGGDTEPESAQYWLNDEDPEMVSATLQTAQAEITRAQAHIAEWNTAVQTLSTEIGSFAAEASSRYQWVNSKAVVWQGELAAAQGYMNTANGYNSGAQTYLVAAQAYVGEAQARMAYADAYQRASAARGAEGGARIGQLNATVGVAAQELQRANVAISEINTIMASYKLDIEGVPAYLQTAQGYIGQAAAYANEIQVRMANLAQEYQWYNTQYQELKYDYSQAFGIARPPAQRQEG